MWIMVKLRSSFDLVWNKNSIMWRNENKVWNNYEEEETVFHIFVHLSFFKKIFWCDGYYAIETTFRLTYREEIFLELDTSADGK